MKHGYLIKFFFFLPLCHTISSGLADQINSSFDSTLELLYGHTGIGTKKAPCLLTGARQVENGAISTRSHRLWQDATVVSRVGEQNICGTEYFFFLAIFGTLLRQRDFFHLQSVQCDFCRVKRRHFAVSAAGWTCRWPLSWLGTAPHRLQQMRETFCGNIYMIISEEFVIFFNRNELYRSRPWFHF